MTSLHDTVTDIVGKMIGNPAVYTKTGESDYREGEILRYKITINFSIDQIITEESYYTLFYKKMKIKKRILKLFNINLKVWNNDNNICDCMYLLDADNLKNVQLNRLKGLIYYEHHEALLTFSNKCIFWFHTHSELNKGISITHPELNKNISIFINKVNIDFINLMLQLI